MNRVVLLFSILAGVAISGCQNAPPPPQGPPLITGKYISQPTGPVQVVGNLPINMILSPDGKFAIVTDIGQNEAAAT